MREIILLIAAMAAFAERPDKVLPAINEIELWQQVGQQPYEMTWVQRSEHPSTLVDFEDLKGWTLELRHGATGELRRSREQQMWGQYVAKMVYAGKSEQSTAIARPPKPIPIPDKFDSVELWGYGNRWSWVEDPSTPPAEVAVLVVDSRGEEIRVPLADIQWKQWWLIHRRVPMDTLKRIAWPASFSGIEIAKAKNKDLRHFYCDSLAFFKETLEPLHFSEQPKRNLKPFRGQIVGTNTGQGTLPFPTREETILPSNFESRYRTAVRQSGTGRFELEYKGEDTNLVYRYSPRGGSLSEISVSINGEPEFHPLEDGGVIFADRQEKVATDGQLVSAKVDGDAVSAKFRSGSRQIDYELRIWQKSLVLDVWCDGGEASGFAFGRVGGVKNPKPLLVPYLTYGPTNPRILMSGDPSKPVFTSVWFDWYRTNASEPYSPKEPNVTPDGAEINGGMRYLPRTDGKRNNLYERIFLTNSGIYEETLPTIANPPSLRQEEGKQVVWTVAFPSTFPSDHKRSSKIRAYGLDHIMQHSHEVTWRDEGDSFTLKLHASPQKGGDAMLQWYIRIQNAMGWLQGVYTNYTDLCTLNSNWSPDHAQRTPDGELRRAWPRNYAMKPAKAVEFDEYYSKNIKDKYGVKMSYTDVHTAVSPWEYCDYDARVPGAGTLAATFYAYGQILLNDQRIYGPTQSEGTFQWLSAGLESGSYGWVYTPVNLLTHPLDVSFRLHKILPLQCDYGMGDTGYYLAQLDKQWTKSPKKRGYIDLLLATTIGYGNMGWLMSEWVDSFGAEALARSYYMMQQLQQQYAFIRPKTIEYADRGGRFLTPSQAHATGAIGDSHLHVEYDNGTHVFVNRGKDGVWKVQSSELPVNGWLVFNRGNGFYESSSMVGGARTDYVKGLEYEFLDGRGHWTEMGNLGASGSVVRRERDAIVELIDLYGNDRIAFKAAGSGEIQAFDPEGGALEKVPVRAPKAGWLEFRTVAGGRKYVYTAR